MRVGNGKVHGLRRMMRGMQAPEQAHLVAEVMINKMAELPNDVSIYKPVPRKRGFEKGIPFKNTNAKHHCGNGNEPAYKAIQHIGEKRDLIINGFKGSEQQRLYKFKKQQHREKRPRNSKNSILREQCLVLPRFYDFDK